MSEQDAEIEGLRGQVATLEKELEQSRRRLVAFESQRDFVTRLLGAVPVIVLVLDREARIVGFNACMEELSGYRLEEVQGRDWFEAFVPARDHARIKGVFEEAVRGHRTRANVNPIVTRDGEERQIEWYDTRLRTAAGEIEAVVALGLDVTERMRLEEEHELLRDQLEDALAKVISGFLPICAGCKNIRDEAGTWMDVESYVRERTGAQFSHGLCAECMLAMHPELKDER